MQVPDSMPDWGLHVAARFNALARGVCKLRIGGWFCGPIALSIERDAKRTAREGLLGPPQRPTVFQMGFSTGTRHRLGVHCIVLRGRARGPLAGRPIS